MTKRSAFYLLFIFNIASCAIFGQTLNPNGTMIKLPVNPGQMQGQQAHTAAVFLPAINDAMPDSSGIFVSTPPVSNMPIPPLLSQQGLISNSQPILVPGPVIIQHPPPPPVKNPQNPQQVYPHTPIGLPIRPGAMFPPQKLISPEDAKSLKAIGKGLFVLRSLVKKPQNETNIRDLISISRNGTNLLRLMPFFTLPRFQARYDETVLRNKTNDSYEYREYGSFQTKLNGWIRTEALYIGIDWKVTGRGGSYIFIRGSVTRTGALSGSLVLDGKDERGQIWNLSVDAKDILPRDDGYPCSGKIKLSGWDPIGKSMSFGVSFPCPIGVPVSMPETRVHLNPSPIDYRK